MKQREREILKNMKEQGFMPDIDIFEKMLHKSLSNKEGVFRAILVSGLYMYVSEQIKTFYLPIAKLIIIQENIK